jgi:GNAT superfamily N-acetyltransferase
VSATIRVAAVTDIAAMKHIRDNVRENALVSGTIEHADYVQAITVDGRAWVYVEDGVVVGFVCGRLTQRDIWALFVSESHERRGIGNELMATVEAWMFDQGIDSIVLVTEPGSRAERLYRRRGWRCEGTTTTKELRFSLRRP